jgi:hypothetical protein
MRSMRIISAPMSAIIMAANGTGPIAASSMTLSPVSVPFIFDSQLTCNFQMYQCAETLLQHSNASHTPSAY